MKEVCESPSEVRRFLGACAFYHIWIPHYAHIADPLYHLLRKGKKLEWKPEHTKAMKKLKKTLRSDKLGCTYDERDEQGASRLHSGDNDAVPR